MFRPLLEHQCSRSSDSQAPYNPAISRSASWSSSLGDSPASGDSETESEQQSSEFASSFSFSVTSPGTLYGHTSTYLSVFHTLLIRVESRGERQRTLRAGQESNPRPIQTHTDQTPGTGNLVGLIT